MKLTILLCLAAIAFDGLEAASTGRSKGGASMQTTYVGKLHETNARGEEECIGTFSGSSNFEQPADCCWSSFAEKCKELLGGLVNILSSSTSCNPCGSGCTSIDLDMKSRITKEGGKSQCETLPKPVQPVVVKQPVYKQVVYKPTEHCGDDCESSRQHVQQPAVVVTQPIYQPIVEQVHVLPVKEACDDCDGKHKHHKKEECDDCDGKQKHHKKDDCDDCDEKKHKHHHRHHHKHHKHHHKNHKKDQCEDDCD